jgi:hypothetical protein
VVAWLWQRQAASVSLDAVKLKGFLLPSLRLYLEPGAWSLEGVAACRCTLGTLALPTAQKLVAGVPGIVKTPGLSASGPGPKKPSGRDVHDVT